MSADERFSAEDRRRIATTLREGGVPTCPRCRTPLDRRSVPPRNDVAYVRDRAWLLCPGCDRAVVLDLKGS